MPGLLRIFAAAGEGRTAMRQNLRKELFSIPNLMGYFRIALLPVYFMIYTNAKSVRDYYIAAGLMFLSFLSDFLDGKIARRFDMVTEFGKILDPIADKLTQGVLFLTFAIRFRPIAVLLAVFLVKESVMGLLGLYMMRKGWNMNGAKLHGKICTFLLDFSMMFLLIFPEIHPKAVLAMSLVCIAAILISFELYLSMYYRAWKSRVR